MNSKEKALRVIKDALVAKFELRMIISNGSRYAAGARYTTPGNHVILFCYDPIYDKERYEIIVNYPEGVCFDDMALKVYDKFVWLLRGTEYKSAELCVFDGLFRKKGKLIKV